MYLKHIVVLITLLLIVASIPSATLIYTYNSDRNPIRRLSFPLLAVTDNNTGTIVNITIEEYFPGSGKISIYDPNGFVGYDTTVSIKYALFISAILTDTNYEIYDYRVVFPQNTRIEGTSATLSFIIGFTYLFKTNRSRIDIGSTGLVSPSLIIGNVSAMREKTIAAERIGIRKVIGAINPRIKENIYIGIPDLLTVYRYLGFTTNYSLPVIPYKPRIYHIAFEKSYSYFIEMIDKIIAASGIPMKPKTYLMAQKYHREGESYVAASYAFRAFIDTIKLYLAKHNSSSTINTIASWIRGNITKYRLLLDKYLSNIKNISLWSLDALMNSFIRYMISNYLYSLYKQLHDTEYLVLSLARIHTAIHWLTPANMSRHHTMILDPNAGLLDRYVNLTINYFSSMKYINSKYFQTLYLNASTKNNSLMKILYYSYILYLINLNIEGLTVPIFDPFKNYEIISEANKSLYDLFVKLYSRVGDLTPSYLSTIDIIRAYMREGEKPSAIGAIISSQILVSMIELILASHFPKYKSIRGGIEYVGLTIGFNYKTLMIIALVLIAIGSFMFGYEVGRVRSSRVWSS